MKMIAVVHMEFISERPGFDNVDAVTNNRMIIMTGEFTGPMMIHGFYIGQTFSSRFFEI